MSSELIGRSPDLKRLFDEGFAVSTFNGTHLLVADVPYVTAERKIARGTLVSVLDLAGDTTSTPKDHVIHFVGSHPCNMDGSIITGITNASQKTKLAEGLEIDHSFSNKPPDGYPDYYAKVTRYIDIISAPARSLARSLGYEITAKTYAVTECREDGSVFQYADTNSSRARIDPLMSYLTGQTVAIIGLGGTGSYILDAIAKTPVAAIHLFDGDIFLQHNAFRSPGAASLESLRARNYKVEYLTGIYSNMRGKIIPHPHHLDGHNVQELKGITSAFISIDSSPAKSAIMDFLLAEGVPFVDTGMGIEEVDGKLFGLVRSTTSTPEKHDHIKSRISCAVANGDLYGSNIQIAELNMLNAALAVIRWKKLLGFYHDLEHEHHSVYNIGGQTLSRDEISS